jgi:hypothetical protein
VSPDGITQIEYYCVFGIYVLTPSVFEELQANVLAKKQQHGEFQLTAALETVLAKEGMTSLVPFGKRYWLVIAICTFVVFFYSIYAIYFVLFLNLVYEFT